MRVIPYTNFLTNQSVYEQSRQKSRSWLLSGLKKSVNRQGHRHFGQMPALRHRYAEVDHFLHEVRRIIL